MFNFEAGDEPSWNGFIVTPGKFTVSAGLWAGDEKDLKYEAPGKEIEYRLSCAFHLVCLDGAMVLSVAGQKVFDGPLRQETDMATGAYIGLLRSRRTRSGFTTFSDLRIRRLP
jgi:hypothetical protein